MHNVVKICRKAIAFLDKRADSDAAEAFDDTLGEIMRCLRVLSMIGDPYCMLWHHVVDAFDGDAGKRTKAAKSTLIYRVHFALKSNSGWWELHAEHVARFEATRCSSTSKSLRAKTFRTHWRRRSSCNRLCRACQCSWPSAKRRSTDFKLKFEEEFKKRVRNFLTAKNDFSEHCLASAMVTWRSILESVVQISPSMTTVCSDYLKKLAVWESELCKQRAMDNFDKLRQVTTEDSTICEAKLSELHLAIRQLLEGAKGTPEQLQQLQSLSALAVDAIVKRCTSGEMAEPVLELLRSVHSAPFFPKDEVARKKVAQLDVWKRLSDAIREKESSGPDLHQRVAAPTSEAKVMEILALAKTFTQDSCLFKRGTPGKRFESDTKSISHQMIKQASSCLKEAVESILFEVDGVGDGKAWSEQIPQDKTDNLEKVMSIAQKTLLTLDGQLFSHKLEQFNVANDRMQRVRELFDLRREDTEPCDLIDRALVTKYTSLMVHHYHEDKKEPNPAKPRRAVRKYRALLQSLAGHMEVEFRSGNFLGTVC